MRTVLVAVSVPAMLFLVHFFQMFNHRGELVFGAGCSLVLLVAHTTVGLAIVGAVSTLALAISAWGPPWHSYGSTLYSVLLPYAVLIALCVVVVRRETKDRWRLLVALSVFGAMTAVTNLQGNVAIEMVALGCFAIAALVPVPRRWLGRQPGPPLQGPS